MFLLRNSFFFQLCFFIFFTSPLYSELLKNKKFPDSNKLLNVNVGLSTLSAPKYEGSSKSVSRIMPFFNLKYKNITFNPVMGLNVNFLDNQDWLLSYGLGFNFGRDPESDVNLNGLKKVNSTFEPKLKAKYKNKYYSIASEISYDLLKRGHKGAYLKTSFNTGFPLIKLKTFIIPSFSFTYADKTYLNNFFGVDDRENLSSGYSKYILESGIKNISASLMVIYNLNDRISINSNLIYKRLVGQVANSPLVSKSDGISTIFSIVYKY